MRLTIGQKAVRVVKFLLGLRHPQVLRALAQYGFTQRQMNQGWELLAGLTQVSFEGVGTAPDPDAITRLDQFENVWFPVAKVTLANHHPEVGGALFRNLAQTAGPGVAVGVGTFLERLGAMARGEGEFAEFGPAARRLLADRGLRDDVVAEAERLIERIQAVRRADAPSLDAKQQRAAEDALWAWYLACSTIARVAVSDRRQLRSMGFFRRKTNGGEALVDDADVLDEMDDPTEPDQTVIEPDQAGVTAPPVNSDPDAPFTNEEVYQPVSLTVASSHPRTRFRSTLAPSRLARALRRGA
jgi:hypothetical protein